MEPEREPVDWHGVGTGCLTLLAILGFVLLVLTIIVWWIRWV